MLATANNNHIIPVRKGEPVELFAGVPYHITVEKHKPTKAKVQIGGKTVLFNTPSLHKYFTDFEEYTLSDAETAMMDGACPSVTGQEVEPDGWDEHGMPSILMAFGFV